MSLVQQVEQAFDPQSQLARVVPSFRAREGQTQMALAVARTLQNGGVLVVEAGTGVGKTFSYLVPALMSGQRVLLSTATKNLQDQLFWRDLPLLVKTLNLPVRTALLKGRSSYLCLQRLEMARQDNASSDAWSQRALARVERWAQSTVSGDLAELPGLDERSPLIPLVTSTRENCLGSQCPQFKSCHVNRARREALGADLLVINHHLFFADLAVRESGMAELLPSVNAVVFDEAHQLNEIGIQFLGRFLSTGQALDLARDILATGLTLAPGLADWQTLVGGFERAVRELRMVAGKQAPGAKLRWTGPAPEGLHAATWDDALAVLLEAGGLLQDALALVAQTAPDFPRLRERMGELAERAASFRQACPANSVRWLEVSTHLRLVESPLDIADAMRDKVLKMDAGQPSGKAWIFTSATLGDASGLTWFTEPNGLQDAELLRVDSPFDYPHQAAVYVPTGLVKPGDPAHSQQVADLASQAAGVLGGRTLVLTTSLRALQTIGEGLRKSLEGIDGIEVLVQGQRPKGELTERFRVGNSQGGAGCVLVASASFWEGVDLPGDALQLVIIDKLPFPPPNDPLVEARSLRLESAGRSPFNEFLLPETAVSLKQGAGRLIRRETDHGLLVLCDTRLSSMGYGSKLMAALPPMQVLRTQAAFQARLVELAELTKTATTG